MPKEPKKLYSGGSTVAKCSQCRRDKQKCLPTQRTWPGRRCDRCIQYEFECSASFTTSRDPEHGTNENRKKPDHVPRKDPRKLFELLDFFRFARFYLIDLAPEHPYLVPRGLDEMPGFETDGPRHVFLTKLQDRVQEAITNDLEDVVDDLIAAGHDYDASYLISIVKEPLAAILMKDRQRNSSDEVGLLDFRYMETCEIAEKLLMAEIKRARRLGCLFTAQILVGRLLESISNRDNLEDNPKDGAAVDTAINHLLELYREGDGRIFNLSASLQLDAIDRLRIFLGWREYHCSLLIIPSVRTYTRLFEGSTLPENIWGENLFHVSARTGLAFNITTNVYRLKSTASTILTGAFRKIDIYGLFPFMTAYIHGHNGLARLLFNSASFYENVSWDPDPLHGGTIEFRPTPDRPVDASELWSPFEILCRIGLEDEITYLCHRFGSQILGPDNGDDALNTAIFGRQLAVFKTLIDLGACITTSHMLLTSTLGYIEVLPVIAALESSGTITTLDSTWREQTLHSAIAGDEVGYIQALLSNFEVDIYRRFNGVSAIDKAINLENREALKAMLRTELMVTKFIDAIWPHESSFLDLILPDGIDWHKPPFINVLYRAIRWNKLRAFADVSRDCSDLPTEEGAQHGPGIELSSSLLANYTPGNPKQPDSSNGSVAENEHKHKPNAEFFVRGNVVLF